MEGLWVALLISVLLNVLFIAMYLSVSGLNDKLLQANLDYLLTSDYPEVRRAAENLKARRGL